MSEPINPRAVAPSSIVTFGRWLGFNYYPWQVQSLVAMANGYNTAIVTCNGSEDQRFDTQFCLVAAPYLPDRAMPDYFRFLAPGRKTDLR